VTFYQEKEINAMFEIFKNLFAKRESVKSKTETPAKRSPATRKKKESAEKSKLTEKEIATKNGEPWISILRVEVNPENINNGSFELDWNDKFVLNLIRSGYKIREDDTDSMIVDRWFQTVCRNIALEVYEQEQADPDNRGDLRQIRRKDIGNGRSEIS
jgi:hypothetical protein